MSKARDQSTLSVVQAARRQLEAHVEAAVAVIVAPLAAGLVRAAEEISRPEERS